MDSQFIGSWNVQLDRLYTGLRQVGLEYWAHQLPSWLLGAFDATNIERSARMPESVVDAGVPAMLAYLIETKRARAAEARVIYLGEGGAGKTSLIKRLNLEPIADDEPPTPRVEIRTRYLAEGGVASQEQEVKIHDWDFGGQVILHATHQFFLREQAVYVIVLDMRRSDSLEYWLDHARVFGKKAPVMIVLNKADQMPEGARSKPNFDLEGLIRRSPNVVGAWVLSCKTEEGFAAFSATLANKIRETLILTSDYPESWSRLMRAWERKR